MSAGLAIPGVDVKVSDQVCPVLDPLCIDKNVSALSQVGKVFAIGVSMKGTTAVDHRWDGSNGTAGAVDARRQRGVSTDADLADLGVPACTRCRGGCHSREKSEAARVAECGTMLCGKSATRVVRATEAPASVMARRASSWRGERCAARGGDRRTAVKAADDSGRPASDARGMEPERGRGESLKVGHEEREDNHGDGGEKLEVSKRGCDGANRRRGGRRAREYGSEEIVYA